MNRQIFAIIAILSLAFMGCGGSKTYKISGTVSMNGVGYEGVTITLSGSPDITTTTDSSGNYSFGDVRKGDYIVTPSLSANGYTQSFSPFSLFPVIDGGSSTGNDFDINVFEVSGQVTMNGSGHPGVTVDLGGDGSGTETTDGSGLYTFWVMSGNYTVTTSLAGQTLQPASITQNIDGFGSINNDFAIDIYDISGRVTLGGFGYQGATVSLSGDAALAFSTDASGNYSFTVMNGTYDVTPTLIGQTFTPADVTSLVISGADSANNDFALDTYTISGQTTLNGSGYQNAQIGLTGTSLSGEVYNSNDFTDVSGNYSFSVLNGNYTLTATETGQTFTPTAYNPVIRSANSAGNDFAFDTYSITGQLTLAGNPYAGAAINLSGDQFEVTATNGSGNFTFSGLLNGNYFVAPDVPGETPSPAQRGVTLAGSNSVNNDFVLGANTITGMVTLNGQGYGGVTVNLTGTSSGSMVTGPSGNYLFVVLNGTYTVTSSLSSQTLTPTSIPSIIINEGDSTGNDFALDTNTLSGQVTLNGSGHPGVSVDLSGATMSDSTTTDGSGFYSFDVLNDTFTVTPSLSGQMLTPGSISGIDISGSASPDHDFVLNTYEITGNVTQQGSPLAGATINLTGDLTDSTSTGAGGDYTLNVLNGTYTVTPVVAGQTLNPANIPGIVISSAADTGNNFAVNTYSLSGQVTLNGSAYQGATITLTGDASMAASTDASGNYSFADLVNGNYTVTPTVAGQTLSPVDLSPTILDADSTGNDFAINTHTISGQVTLSGSGYPSAQVSLTGDSTASTSTDGSGNYSFTNLVNGNYTVTPTVSGQTLSPTFTGITITDADSTGNDFDINTWTISGQVTLNGSGYTDGATVNLSNGAIDSTTTDGSGNYSFTGLLNADYTVTPVVANQTLTPLDVDLTIANADSTGNDFALDTYTISGQVTLLGAGYAGATVALSGEAIASTITPASGNYAFTGLLNGNYTLSPTVSGQSLIPANYNLDITGTDLTGNDFAVSTNTISGQVYLNGSVYPGATITLSGAASMAVSTDGTGSYSFPDLLNGSYTVTPTVAGQTLSPADYDINISDSSSIGNDFTINTYTISGQVTVSGSGYAGASVDLTGAGTDSTSTDGSGNYSFTGLLSGDYTVTPSVLNQTLTPADRDITIGLADSTGNDFAIDIHTISGTVTLNGSAYPGATITLTGDASMAATTDGSGNYSFPDLLNGSYTVTPTVAGQTLSPANYNLNVSGASQPNTDFIINTWTISGQVTLSGSGYAGATVALSGAATASTITPASGNYSFTGLLNGDYTVTPTVGGQALTPVDYDISISDSSSAGNDFAVSTNTISGQVTLNGSAYPGATITLSGDASDSTTTDGSGNYAFPDLLNGSYTVTPTVAGQTLNPADYDINISDSSSTGNDFTINTYTISGQVTLGGSGYPGATVDLSNALADSTTTDGSGNYSFTGLLSGDYTVTPSVSGQTLTPADRDITIGLADSTGNDFALDTYTISGQVTLGGSGYSGATVDLSNALADSTTTDGSGNYSFTGLLSGDYTVTPSVSGQTLTPADRDITIGLADSTGNDFALDTYTISGQVTLGGSGYPGATVDLSNALTDSTTTDGSGNYSFTGLLSGSYTVTPDVSGQTLTPADRDIIITLADSTGNDFAINVWTISGNVSNGSGPMEWVNVGLSGDSTASTRTDSSGDYSFTNVLNGNYTVTPVSAPQTFSPTSDSFSVSGSDETGRDFSIPSMIWTANIDATATTMDGYSWETAFRHPQDAASAAGLAGTAVGDQVWVANGPYYAYGDTTDITVPVLMLQEGFEYYGGFAGTETALSERDHEANATTLDGLDVAQEIVVAADNSVLNGFVVYQGLIPAYQSTYVAPVSAAGVSNFSVIDCLVTGNTASTEYHINSSGMNFGSGLILNTTFRNNWGWNGPLFVFGNSTENVDIINVASYYNNALYGGGMLLGGEGPIRVLNTTIANNSTSDPWEQISTGKGIWMHMGGMFLPPGDAIVTNTIVYGDIDGHGTTVGENLPVVTYSLMESFGATYEAVYADPTNIFASTLGNTPNFVSWASSPVYVGNHPFQIASNSPCIDAGNDAAIPTTILNDVYGAQVDMLQNPRSVDWPPTAGTGVDIGAYEFIAPWEPGMP